MTARELKGMEGRRVLVEGTLLSGSLDDDGEAIVMCVLPGEPDSVSSKVWVKPELVREILPPKLTVGGRFKDVDDNEGTVLAIAEGHAMVKYDARRFSITTWRVEQITAL